MALINCPNCNQEVSDKSANCIYCGSKIKSSPVKCEECGTIISDEEEYCSKCGCPKKGESQKVEITGVSFKNKKKITGIIIGIVVFIVIAAILTLFVVLNNKNKSEDSKYEYESNLKEITKTMLEGAAEAEECGNMIRNIWYNTIFEKEDSKTNPYTKTGFSFNDDFNDSLSSYFSSDEYEEHETYIKNNKIDVNDLMKKLKNPPEEWEDAYDDLKEYYNDYLKLTGMCLDPQGNLTTYTSNFSDADTNTYNGYQKMQQYFDN